MCGIAGIHGLEGLADAESVMRRMCGAMAHRGPDAEGVARLGNNVLGHRRLSIIDLSAASNQPFTSADGRYTIAFNGEIYNYRELKRELDGHPWRTGSDTEVLLVAFARWGEGCLNRLHGMFAFAVHDRMTDELFLARDRMGIKPLYWYRDDQRVLFASEVRALLASGLVPRRLDSDALVDHLRYQTVRAPETLIQGVRMLEAGHWMRIGDQEVTTVRWYDLVRAVHRDAEAMPLPEVHRTIRARLAGAVEKRLVSDVPFGAFLSGGIDSSAIVGLMAQASTAPVHTFSVVFDESEFSEERYARMVADRFRTRHTAIRLKPEDMLRMLPDALAAMDHPSADGPNTYVVSKVTKGAGVTMALSGLGGDEVFAGYPVFPRTIELWNKRWITQFPKPLRVAAAALMATARPSIASDKLGELLRRDAFTVDETFPVSRLVFTDRDLRGLLARQALPPSRVAATLHRLIRTDAGHDLPLLSQVSLGELGTYLQDVLLRDTDQMSMAHALEVRVPFLDHDLVEFVLGVSDRLKYPVTPKKLLVDALGDLLPSEIVHRPKMGFTLPWELWMRNELRPFCEERLHRLDRRPQFRPGAIVSLWDRFLAGDKRVNWARVWSQVVLEDWMSRNGVE
ncbi:MAG: asparagine synthase (glutamine-hydrolyzing) [Flavobacteriales bacterium]|nr:MAG: asparagine synthase (glutamine-hydrolyzing) [Flavobacteriales bacterium]